MNTDIKNQTDDDVTESTESINAAIVDGRFDIVLDVKKINTNRSTE